MNESVKKCPSPQCWRVVFYFVKCLKSHQVVLCFYYRKQACVAGKNLTIFQIFKRLIERLPTKDWELYWGEGGGTVGNRGVRDIAGKPTETARLSQRNSKREPTTREPAGSQPLHICDSCVAWSFCGTRGNRSRIPGCFDWLLRTYSSLWTVLPTLKTGRAAWSRGSFICRHDSLKSMGGLPPFWLIMKEGWTEEEGCGEEGGEVGGEKGMEAVVRM